MGKDLEQVAEDDNPLVSRAIRFSRIERKRSIVKNTCFGGVILTGFLLTAAPFVKSKELIYTGVGLLSASLGIGKFYDSYADSVVEELDSHNPNFYRR